MALIDRDDIHIISRNSNWSAPGVDRALKDHVYNHKAAWQQFLKLLFLSLGIGFTTAGVLFFFAYNWDSLHKFVKMGLIEGLIIIITLVIVFARINSTVKNILLTAVSVIVGVLMAVFGQVYQTGANAYDLFLSWTLSITLWVIISNFAPLWLVYITLISATLILYGQQVAQDWSDVLLYTLQFLLNTCFLLLSLLLSKYKPALKAPSWFPIILTLAAVTVATMGMITGIFDQHQPAFIWLILVTLIMYAAGVVYGFQRKSPFYLSIIFFSLIVILSAWFIRLSDGGSGTLLFTSLFIIGSVTLLIKKIIDIQKKWSNEKGA